MNDLLKNKWILSMILILVAAVAVWFFLWDSGDSEDRDVQVDQQIASIEEEAAVHENNGDEAASASQEGYYFVKESDGAVNVYWYEGEKKELYQKTDIEFSLLSSEDQELLKTGVQLKNEQELANFLENFDS